MKRLNKLEKSKRMYEFINNKIHTDSYYCYENGFCCCDYLSLPCCELFQKKILRFSLNGDAIKLDICQKLLRRGGM